MLQIRNLSVAQDGRAILSDVSLSVRPGRFVALVGPNGAGKSTLLSALAGRHAMTGHVAWFGRDLAQWSRRDLACHVAMMQQAEPPGFDFLVHEYIGLGRLPRRGQLSLRHERAVITAAMAALDLGHLADRHLPTLSGGERQRAQMARCLVQLWAQPDRLPGDDSVLLLDEPTSALDLGQQARLLNEAYDFTRRGGTCMAVLHDLNLAATYADEVAVLLDGGLVAQGTPQQVLTAANVSRWYQTAVIGARAEGATSRVVITLPGPQGPACATAGKHRMGGNRMGDHGAGKHGAGRD